MNAKQEVVAIYFLVISILISGCAPGQLFGPTFTPTFTQTLIPTPTATPKPTATKAPTFTPTPLFADCINWLDVTKEMIGQDLYVYGKVQLNSQVFFGSTYRITFSIDPDAFFLASGTFYYPDMQRGDCARAEGEVLRSGSGVPYMNVDKNLYYCESWME